MSRPLRVLQLSDFYPPVTGGMERVVRDLSLALAERGLDVAVATLTERPQPTPGVERHVLRSATAMLPGGHADPDRPFHPTFPDPLTRRDLDVLVRRWRPDVVHAHSWAVNSWLGLRRRHPGVRTVVYAHDYGTFCVRKTNVRDGRTGRCDRPGPIRCVTCARGQYGPARSAGLTAGVLAMRGAVGSADALVAVSSWVARSLSAGLGVAVPSVIPPAVRLPGQAARPRPDFLPQGRYVLYVGQVSAHKGLDVLLQAMAHVRGAPLVILGIATPGRQPPRHDGVTVRLDVPHETVMAAWQHATVGVVPSLWGDPMPLVALEAMSQGVPLVASAVGGLMDSVEHGVTGIRVPPGDPTALGTAIRRLMDDDAGRRRLAAAAVARAGEYAIDSVVERWLARYRHVVGGSVPVPAWPPPGAAR